MRGVWENLDPKYKRWVAIGLGGVVIISVVALFSGGETTERRKTSREDSIRHILTDTNTREVGIDALSADLKLVTRENETLRRDLERFKEEVARNSGQASADKALSRDLARMQEELEKLKEQNEELADQVKKGGSGGANEGDETDPRARNRTPTNTAEAPVGAGSELDYSNPEDFFKNAPVPETKPEDAENDRGARGQAPKPKGLTIASYSSSSAEDEEVAEVDGNDDDMFMPAGSIITGVLINGMDAPTAQGARQDPFPATLRIQKEAILPNRFRADIRECFLIISGYGDLSSERAYLRGETLSCVKDNGEVIETPFDAYAVGEDGKAGIRGRLVSKQGQIIAKSLMAGFLSGAAEAFDVDAVPTLNLDSTGQTQFQQTEFSSTLAQGAAAKGASNALDRIAQFYIEMAEGIFPVIEIDAGRQVEIIVTKGSSLRVRGSKAE